MPGDRRWCSRILKIFLVLKIAHSAFYFTCKMFCLHTHFYLFFIYFFLIFIIFIFLFSINHTLFYFYQTYTNNFLCRYSFIYFYFLLLYYTIFIHIDTHTHIIALSSLFRRGYRTSVQFSSDFLKFYALTLLSFVDFIKNSSFYIRCDENFL